jgi:hypothetical protein
VPLVAVELKGEQRFLRLGVRHNEVEMRHQREAVVVAVHAAALASKL